jgi:choline kinase
MENNKIKEIIKNLQEQDAKDYHDGMINGLSEDSVRAFLSMLDEGEESVNKESCNNCKYYEPDFNGKEVCAFSTLEYSSCPEELPKERICKDYTKSAKEEKE